MNSTRNSKEISYDVRVLFQSYFRSLTEAVVFQVLLCAVVVVIDIAAAVLLLLLLSLLLLYIEHLFLQILYFKPDGEM